MDFQIKRAVPIAPLTTYQIGGPAKNYVAIADPKVLPAVFAEVRKAEEPYFVLGGGSNVVVSDKGFPGTVIHMQNKGFERDETRVVASAGEKLGDLVDFCVNEGLEGLEWAAGIPGTVGGAVLGNAGAFYGTMADVVRQVQIYDPHNNEFQQYWQKECGFAYRTSQLKHSGEIIISVELGLKAGCAVDLRRKASSIREYRLNRHPIEPSAGSVFRNITDMKFIKPFVEAYPEAREPYKLRWKGKIPSAFLIEMAGLKGQKIGGVQIADKHSAFIINIGNATAEEVAIMSSLVKERVWNRFGIHLREEVRYIGF